MLAAAADAAVTATPRVPLRPLGAAEVLDGALRVTRRNARAMFTVSVPVAVLIGVATALLALAQTGQSSTSTAVLFPTLAVAAAADTLATGLLAPLVAADVLRGPALLGAALQQAARRGLGVLLLAVLGVVTALLETAGLFLLAVGGVWLWGIWAVAAPAMSVERLGLFRALGRSFQLTRRHFGRAWGVRALGWLVVTVVGLALRLPFSLAAAAVGSTNVFANHGAVSHPGLYVTLLAAGAVVSGAVTLPITAAVQTLIYTDLRMRNEGMDIALALRATVPPAPVW